ncbi:hypothetical protein HanRHA438_Chr02g0090321 [Helianthus annuus]|uniref:Uncharacterized protein n=1 Tax=Helianthus annuus TaxID=4232 RepID=A0A9K3P156_HELAN|nr:hypothetical protein HanXRQr2_Chr02g0078981 [Helianthus annuus]KAJ0941061.1 hypothetical protein HanRHA438_Chr02g0090321 [Helianthus annuus]
MCIQLGIKFGIKLGEKLGRVILTSEFVLDTLFWDIGLNNRK